jgi:hypothetical protein
MFKLTITDVEAFGPEYYNIRRVVFGRSPKQCWEKIYTQAAQVSGGHPEGWGGTPVLQQRKLEKNGKPLYNVWG